MILEGFSWIYVCFELLQNGVVDDDYCDSCLINTGLVFESVRPFNHHGNKGDDLGSFRLMNTFFYCRKGLNICEFSMEESLDVFTFSPMHIVWIDFSFRFFFLSFVSEFRFVSFKEMKMIFGCEQSFSVYLSSRDKFQNEIT